MFLNIIENTMGANGVENGTCLPFVCENCNLRFRVYSELINHKNQCTIPIKIENNGVINSSVPEPGEMGEPGEIGTEPGEIPEPGEMLMEPGEMNLDDIKNGDDEDDEADEEDEMLEPGEVTTEHGEITADGETKNFKCHICGKKYAYITGLEKHMMTCAEKRHHCSYCGDNFELKTELKQHLLDVHNINGTER